MSGINKPNDHFFRDAISYPEVAKQFFKLNMPEQIYSKINFEKMRVMKDTFVNSALNAFESDVVIKVGLDNADGYIYILCEQQTAVDKYMSIRLREYVGLLMRDHLKKNKTMQLPIVYPMVVYVGKEKWTAKRNFYDLFGEQSALAMEVDSKPYGLVDLQRLSDDEIERQQLAGVLSFVMKHRVKQNGVKFLREFIDRLQLLERSDLWEFGRTVVIYVLDYLSESVKEEFFIMAEQQLAGGMQRATRSISDALRDEGRQEGRLEGEIQAARRFAKRALTQGVDVEIVVSATGLSKVEVFAMRRELQL